MTLPSLDMEPNNVQIKDGIQDLSDKQSSKLDEMDDYELVPKPLDGGYGWIIVLTASLSCFISLVFFGTFGVFFVEFLEYFNVHKSYISWIGFIMLISKVVFSFATPYLVKKFGCRILGAFGSIVASLSYMLSFFAQSVAFLYFSMGFLIGISCLFVEISREVIVQQYFHEKRALATSLSILGNALAILIWPPVTRFLIDTYSWRGTMLILSGCTLNGLVFVSFWRPPKMKKVLKVNNAHHKKLDDFSLSVFLQKYLTYILMFFGWFGNDGGHVTTLIYTPVRAEVMGLSKNEGALLLSIIGITTGLCRVLAGRIGDIKCVNRNVLAAAAVIYSGSISLVSIIFKSFTPMVVFSVMFGVGSGFYTGLIGACIYDVVGIQDISLGYLIFHIASGTSSGVTMPIAGYLYDATKSPVATVVTFGAVQITGGLFLLSIPFIQARLKRIDNSSADSNTSC